MDEGVPNPEGAALVVEPKLKVVGLVSGWLPKAGPLDWLESLISFPLSPSKAMGALPNANDEGVVEPKAKGEAPVAVPEEG